MINKMEKEKNNGQMVPVIMEDIKMVKKMDLSKLKKLNGVINKKRKDKKIVKKITGGI